MHHITKHLMLAVCVGVFVLSSFMAMAKPKEGKGEGPKVEKSQSHEGYDKGKSQSHEEDNDDDIDIHFLSNDKKEIDKYFHEKGYKHEALPPGIAKNLARGKPLPPGIAKKPLPEDLLEDLHLDSNYDYWMVGNDIAAVSRATGIVADLFNIHD